MTAPEAAGVQRAQPFGRGLGPPRVLICSPFPPSFQEGGRGIPRISPSPRLPRRFTPRNDRAGDRRRPEGAAPASGESRGVQPHWQAVWRMCLHDLHFCTSPLPFRKGVGGWSKPSLRQLSPEQASRGRRPLAGVWGCPPECSFAPPFRPHPPVFPHYPVIASLAKQSGAVGPTPFRHSPAPDRRAASLLAMTAPETAGVQRAQPPQAGSPEGCNPTGRRYGGCASMTYTSVLPPFLSGRGPGGWCVPQLYYGLQSNLWYASDLQDGVRPGTAVYR